DAPDADPGLDERIDRRDGVHHQPARRDEVRAAIRYVPRLRCGGRRDGRDRPHRLVSESAVSRSAGLSDAAWPVGLLAALVALVRLLPAVVSPTAASDDCSHAASSDLTVM